MHILWYMQDVNSRLRHQASHKFSRTNSSVHNGNTPDDHIIGSYSLPKVENCVTAGILGDPNRHQRPQLLHQLTSNAGTSVHESKTGIPEQQPVSSISSEPIHREAKDLQEPSLLIGAMHGTPTASPELHMDRPGVNVTELHELPHTTPAQSESGSFDDAPDGFFLVAHDTVVCQPNTEYSWDHR